MLFFSFFSSVSPLFFFFTVAYMDTVDFHCTGILYFHQTPGYVTRVSIDVTVNWKLVKFKFWVSCLWITQQCKGDMFDPHQIGNTRGSPTTTALTIIIKNVVNSTGSVFLSFAFRSFSALKHKEAALPNTPDLNKWLVISLAMSWFSESAVDRCKHSRIKRHSLQEI